MSYHLYLFFPGIILVLIVRIPSSWHLGHFDFFLVFPYFQTQDIPGSSCVFLAQLWNQPFLQGALAPLEWRMVFGNQDVRANISYV